MAPFRRSGAGRQGRPFPPPFLRTAYIICTARRFSTFSAVSPRGLPVTAPRSAVPRRVFLLILWWSLSHFSHDPIAPAIVQSNISQHGICHQLNGNRPEAISTIDKNPHSMPAAHAINKMNIPILLNPLRISSKSSSQSTQSPRLSPFKLLAFTIRAEPVAFVSSVYPYFPMVGPKPMFTRMTVPIRGIIFFVPPFAIFAPDNIRLLFQRVLDCVQCVFNHLYSC